MTIDETDKKILALIQQDASLTVKEIAQKVHLSTTPCWKRVQRLEKAGVIKAKVAILEPSLIGVGAIVYIMIQAADYSNEWSEHFQKEIAKIDEILESYRISGEVDVLLKAAVSDIAAYDKLLKKIVSRIKVRDISAVFAIEQLKHTTALPLKVDLTS